MNKGVIIVLFACNACNKISIMTECKLEYTVCMRACGVGNKGGDL